MTSTSPQSRAPTQEELDISRDVTKLVGEIIAACNRLPDYADIANGRGAEVTALALSGVVASFALNATPDSRQAALERIQSSARRIFDQALPTKLLMDLLAPQDSAHIH